MELQESMENKHNWAFTAQGSELPGCAYRHPANPEAVCPFPCEGAHDGRALCWVHLAAAKGETLEFDEAASAVLRSRITAGVLKCVPEWRVSGLNLESVTAENFEILTSSMIATNFSWAVLGGLQVGYSDLGASVFSFSRGCNSRFFRSTLIAANFTSSAFTCARFSDCKLCEAVLRRSSFQFASFKNCDLSGAHGASADFSSSRLESCDLSGSSFRNARFRYAELRAVDLSNADLRGADFTGAAMVDVIFKGAKLTGTIGL